MDDQLNIFGITPLEYHEMSMKKRAARRREINLLIAKETAFDCLSQGKTYGILCRRFEGWYIKSIMAYLSGCGLNVIYEKIQEKGIGFQGYLIKTKTS